LISTQRNLRREEPPTLSPYPEEDEAEDEAYSSSEATTSLVLGIVSLVCGLLTGIPAIIYGIIAKKSIARSRGRELGAGRATVGLCLGAFGTVASVVLIVVLLFLVKWPPRQPSASERIRSQNNLIQCGLAMIMYADEHAGRILDEAAIRTPNGQKLLSWRVALLPYIEEGPLYNEFHLNEPWDSEHNRRLIPKMPKIYLLPVASSEEAAAGMTHYRAIIGPETAFAPGSRYPAHITDGTSQTIMIVEAEEPVPWTKPDELGYDTQRPLPQFNKRSRAGFNAVLWDASVRIVNPKISELTLRAAITAHANDILGPDW
jgi:hypothetical protein